MRWRGKIRATLKGAVSALNISHQRKSTPLVRKTLLTISEPFEITA